MYSAVVQLNKGQTSSAGTNILFFEFNIEKHWHEQLLLITAHPNYQSRDLSV